MPREIIKVQIPLNDPGPALIYAKGRDRMVTRQLFAHEWEKMAGITKGYFVGHWSSIVGWAIGERVADQGW